VPDARPRLLVALPPGDEFGETIGRLLPGIPWGYLETTPPEERTEVEAMLVGSFAREVGDFDPSTTPRLSFVQRAYTGLDGFPFGRFPDQVRVAGNVGAFAPYVSEHAVALALAAARELVASHQQVRAGRLRPHREQRLLSGATAVVLGYGEIGRAIAHQLAGFNVRVLGLNRTGAAAPGCAEMYSADRMNEVLALGDFVFEVRPLTNRTRHSIGTAELNAMRPEAVFVNVGRAATVDEEALFHHLETHPAFRAAFDVWWNEDYVGGTLPHRFPFADLPNFLGTPHTAGYAPGVQTRGLRLALENLGRYFRDGQPLHVVDRQEYPR
jgi:phosphoglycerate dehydrogenase-like enzyme